MRTIKGWMTMRHRWKSSGKQKGGKTETVKLAAFQNKTRTVKNELMTPNVCFFCSPDFHLIQKVMIHLWCFEENAMNQNYLEEAKISMRAAVHLSVRLLVSQIFISHIQRVSACEQRPLACQWVCELLTKALGHHSWAPPVHRWLLKHLYEF